MVFIVADPAEAILHIEKLEIFSPKKLINRDILLDIDGQLQPCYFFKFSIQDTSTGFPSKEMGLQFVHKPRWEIDMDGTHI